MHLIVGLGNPGRGYAANRHNIGFMCLNRFARTHGIKFNKKQSKARLGTGNIAGKEVVLAKPQTFMNSSGESVSLLVQRFNVGLDSLLIIHDDLDLSLGKIRIRQGSSAGGHKGAQSIITSLGSQDFVRLRIGIGRPAKIPLTEQDIVDYVLSNFTPEEKQDVSQTIPKVSEAILCFLTDGLKVAMNKFNG